MVSSLRTRFAIPVLTATAIALALVLPGAAAAAPLGSVTAFPTPESGFSFAIAPGSDGNLWFTQTVFGAPNIESINRITPEGTITPFTSGLSSTAFLVQDGIAAGPDGNLWFTDRSGSAPAIGVIDPSTGAIEEFPLSAGSVPRSIVTGPEGELWFTDGGATKAIGKIDPTTHAIEEFTTGLNAEAVPFAIAAGPDGNLWFTDRSGSAPAIGRVTPAGTITEFGAVGSGDLEEGSRIVENVAATTGAFTFGLPIFGAGIPAGTTIVKAEGTVLTLSNQVEEGKSEIGAPLTAGVNPGGEPGAITAGPDGNLWFTDDSQSTPAIGRVTPAGALTEFSSGLQENAVPSNGITPGPDGNVWFVDNAADRALGRITPSGSITEFRSGLESTFLTSVVPGADGNLWLTDNQGHRIIRFGVGAPAPSLEAPSVNGTAQVGTQQTCAGDRWASWAGMQPENGGLLASSTSPSAFQWFVEGSPVGTSRTYTPVEADEGKELTCTKTVTYRQPFGVTTSATSEPVTVIAQNSGPEGKEGKEGKQGPAGSNGSNGKDGAQGPAGKEGAQGPQGPAGRDAKVTCTVKKKGTKVKVTCKVQLSASASSARLRWRLMRGGRAYAHGSATARHHRAQLNLDLSQLQAGRYLLRLQGDKGGTAILVG